VEEIAGILIDIRLTRRMQWEGNMSKRFCLAAQIWWKYQTARNTQDA